MKRFLLRLFTFLGTGVLICLLSAFLVWLYVIWYLHETYETYAIYLFFSAFIYIIIGLYFYKDDSKTADHYMAKSVSEHKDDNAYTWNEVKYLNKFFSISTLMFIVGLITFFTSYILSK